MTGSELRPVWWDGEGNLLTEDLAGGETYVMVQFEKPMMEAVANIICRNGGNILNVGFGCGLVDEAIQRHEIASHTIVEPHPQVYEHMLELGWGDKPGVTILNSRWQDVDWSPYYGHFDGIFWDPFSFDSNQKAQLDRVGWSVLVTRLVRPETGVFVMYEVASDPQVAEKKEFLDPDVVGAAEACEVSVPFDVAEWRHLGPGRHRVYIPYFKVVRDER